MNIRILPISLMLALCLASCSSSQQDDPVIPDPTPNPTPSETSIGFGGNSGSWENAPTSRAANEALGSRATNTRVGLESLFRSFRVWGYKASQVVMDGYYVNYKENTAGSTTSNTADWEYVGISNPSSTPQTIKYWDYSAADYRFFAYSPADAKGVTVTSDTKTSESDGTTAIKKFTIPYEYSENATATSVPYVSDLWYSDNNTSSDVISSAPYGKSVTLTFAPLVPKVRFKFSYPDETTDVEITDIKFRDSRFIDDETKATTPIRGSIVATYPQSGKPTSTSQSGTTERYTPEVSWETSTAKNATGPLVFAVPDKWYYVPPLGNSSFEQGPYTITATINGNETSATVPAVYMQWRVGFQYTYIFKITLAGTGITFEDLEVEQWLPGDNIDNNGNGTTGW